MTMDERTAWLRQPNSIGQAFLWALLPSLALLLIASPAVSLAQVVTNITPTSIAPLDLGTNVDTVGSTTSITGGTRPGSSTNLFHSFDSFTLGTGDVAHFMNDMQLPTTNIFGRVIGGEVSTIDGTLRTNNPLNAADPMNFGAANLWLVNPSGLFLGPNVHLEVGGSVSMSTANYLRFEGTAALFDMLASPVSLGPLDVAPVVAFGFMGSNPEAITVQGSQVSVTEGHSLSLVGGTISIESGTAEGGTVQPVQLSAPNGTIQLASAASPGEFDAATLQPLPNVDGTSFTSFGSVSLAPGSSVNVSGASTVFIKGGKIVLSVDDAVLTTTQTPGPPETISLSPGSFIETSNSGTDPGADLQLTASKVQMDGAFMGSSAHGDGPGGNITANVGTLSLADGAAIITVSGGPGSGGDVHITANNLTLENGSSIITDTFGLGDVGGDLILNVGKLRLLGGPFGGSQIRSTNLNDGTNQGSVGGNVTVQANSVVLSGGSGLLSQTFGSGDAGRISITAKSLDMDGFSTIHSATGGTGVGGDIVVGVRQVRLLGGATITTQTFSADPDAGAGGTVTVQGLQGAGSKASSVVLSGQSTGIVSDSTAGQPGDLTVNAGTLTITNGAAIAAGNPTSTGPAGEVTIIADSILIASGGQISSHSSAEDAGQVTLTANALTLDNGSIDTSTASEIGGRGGDVVVHGGTVSLTNGANINSQSESFSTGQAGDITMTVGSLTLANNANITSSSQGFVADAGDAGTITIQSGSTVVLSNSSITTEAINASGGQITITAPEMVRLINTRISTSVAGDFVDPAGGNITIDPQFVILQNSQFLSQAATGPGGNISVTAGALLVDPSTVFDAGSQLGGEIHFESPLAHVIGQMSHQFSSAAGLLLASQCAADPTGQFSSFVQTGREGVPQIPGALSPSPLLFLESLTSSSLGSPLPNGAAAWLGLDSVRFDDSTRFLSVCRS